MDPGRAPPSSTPSSQTIRDKGALVTTSSRGSLGASMVILMTKGIPGIWWVGAGQAEHLSVSNSPLHEDCPAQIPLVS